MPWSRVEPREPFFDVGLNAWIVSRYADVAEALRNPGLAPSSARSAAPAPDRTVHAEFRSSALRELAGRDWAVELGALTIPPAEGPSDLVGQCAAPWSLAVAGMATGVPPEDLPRLAVLARHLFDAASEPFDVSLDGALRAGTTGLATYFQGSPAIYLQMFVALALSLPAFLGSAWWALLENPSQIERFAAEPRAVDELLRYAGPARAQFRQAVADTTIGGLQIRQHDRVVLRLDSANRDPRQFQAPDELRLNRREGGHLAFGGGLHACLGGMVIQTAAAAATTAVLGRLAAARGFHAEPVEGFGIRWVRSLQVW